MPTITIRETRSNGNEWTTTVRRYADDLDSEIINRAVRKLFGRHACFIRDNVEYDVFGQVFESTPLNGMTSVTGSVRVDFA